MDVEKIKNEELQHQIWLLYGALNIMQMAKDLGRYERQDGDRPVRIAHPSDWKPLDQSLVRRWLTGERPVPRWAQVAVADLLVERLARLANYVSAALPQQVEINPAYVEQVSSIHQLPWSAPADKAA